MKDNIFVQTAKELSIEDFVGASVKVRENMGADIPVFVYRLFEYTIKDEMTKKLGKETAEELLRKAGYQAGTYFADKFLDLTQSFESFVAQLQKKFQECKMGILRIEHYVPETGRIVLTIAEDADCSGLPVLGETVCNYDEGFISGILTVYTNLPYEAVEVDCWATGDRVCRFEVYPSEK